MREILFRGKIDRLFNRPFESSFQVGDWVEGSLIVRQHCAIVPTGSKLRTQDVQCSINPETIGQYTGLVDKNGKRIFEGDVLLIGESTLIIEWDNREAGYHLFWTDDSYYSHFYVGLSRKSIVIGNIHDNPELLER